MGARYRQLDSLEAGFALLNRNGAGGANLVAVAELDFALDETRLRDAAAALQRECAWLRARIVEDDDVLWFCEDASAIAVRVHRGDADTAFDHELATALPLEGGPLCRITAVKRPAQPDADALVLCIHHSICDGNTVQALLYRLLSLCTGDPPRNLPALANGAFPAEPLTQQSRPSWPLRKRAYAWYRLFRYAALTRKGRLVRFETAEADPARRTTTRQSWAFERDETAAIVQAARTHGASVTGALCAAALWTARAYDASAPAMRLRVTCNVSLWPLLDPAGPQWPSLGNFVTMIQLGAHLPAQPSFWQVARTCTAAARDRPRETVRDVSMLVGALVRPRAARMLAKLTHDPRTCGRGAAVHVSNMGIIDGNTRPPHLRTFHAAMPQHAAGAMLWLSAATVRDRLHGTLLTVAPLISAETSATFVPALRKALLDATNC